MALIHDDKHALSMLGCVLDMARYTLCRLRWRRAVRSRLRSCSPLCGRHRKPTWSPGGAWRRTSSASAVRHAVVYCIGQAFRPSNGEQPRVPHQCCAVWIAACWHWPWTARKPCSGRVASMPVPPAQSIHFADLPCQRLRALDWVPRRGTQGGAPWCGQHIERLAVVAPLLHPRVGRQSVVCCSPMWSPGQGQGLIGDRPGMLEWVLGDVLKVLPSI